MAVNPLNLQQLHRIMYHIFLWLASNKLEKAVTSGSFFWIDLVQWYDASHGQSSFFWPQLGSNAVVFLQNLLPCSYLDSKVCDKRYCRSENGYCCSASIIPWAVDANLAQVDWLLPSPSVQSWQRQQVGCTCPAQMRPDEALASPENS
jgi:hypothetical protein